MTKKVQEKWEELPVWGRAVLLLLGIGGPSVLGTLQLTPDGDGKSVAKELRRVAAQVEMLRTDVGALRTGFNASVAGRSVPERLRIAEAMAKYEQEEKDERGRRQRGEN